MDAKNTPQGVIIASDFTLFEAVSAVTEVGDLFVVSGEFQPANDLEKYIDELTEAYDQAETRDVALGAVRTLLDEEGYARDGDARRKFVDVEIVRDTSKLPKHIRSIIPETVAAVFRLNVPIKDVYLTLVASKRYKQEPFKLAVADFKCIETHELKRSKCHKYFVFQRE